ncbi:MAG: 2-iminoacetate synthase ThiH [Cetobacterium sp.]|uniref:2-iminoacetate synthase ThiH n=1 Tax=Cetobacterium sp. TaxID=2071632 RepID=UPI003F2A3DBF
MFYSVIEKYKNFNYENFFSNISTEKIKSIINNSGKKNLEDLDFLALLKPNISSDILEIMAQKANEISIQYFGKEIQLYGPLYISNICDNECTYCAFKKSNGIKRRHLTYEEIETEAKYISENLKLDNIILLTGESTVNSIEYLSKAIEILKKYFSTVIIEIHPMDKNHYEELFKVGLDGVTVYQECYNEELYKNFHLEGKKSDYRYRLDTPQRAGEANLRAINIGTLFGLGNIVEEGFLSGLHGKYLMNNFLNSEISISLPRIREAFNNISGENILDDRYLVQILMAYRISFPTLGINISTRESSNFRDNLIPLGVTKFSAGSVTEVGGYSIGKKTLPQFATSDHRSVSQIEKAIKNLGYQPIFKNWLNL